LTVLDRRSNSARVAGARSKTSRTTASAATGPRDDAVTAADIFDAALDISGKPGLTIELAARVFAGELELAAPEIEALASWMKRELSGSDRHLRQGSETTRNRKRARVSASRGPTLGGYQGRAASSGSSSAALP
jgi:hypothetical protein